MTLSLQNQGESITAFNNSEKEKRLREAFSKLKEEMNDHLDAINENTNEIGSTNEYMAQLEEMINKLNERLDDVEMKVSELSGKKISIAEDYKNIVLNPKEEEIFFILYSRTGDLIDSKEISRTLGITEESARKYIASMIGKGIPVVRKYFDEKTFFVLDPDFRNLQAKENIVKLKRK